MVGTVLSIFAMFVGRMEIGSWMGTAESRWGMEGSLWSVGRRDEFEIESEKRGKSGVFLELESMLTINKIDFNYEARGSDKIDGCRG